MSLPCKTATDLRAELQISPKPILIALTAATLTIGWGLEVFSRPDVTSDQMIPVSLLACTLSAIGWFLISWRPTLGRWFVILSYGITINLGSLLLRVPEAMLLTVIPVILAFSLIGPSAAVALAIGETSFVVALLHNPIVPFGSPEAVVTCLGIWMTIAAMYGFVHRVYYLVEWIEREYEHVQQVVYEARHHREELEQTLQELAHANRQLVLANERIAALRTMAEEARRAKTAFVANVSHELRTPLNIIVGLVELMVEHPEVYSVILSPKMHKDLTTVYRNCERLCNMINDILDLTRVEAGHLTLSREPTHLKEIVDHCATLVEPLLRARRCTLRLAIPETLPKVYCDRIRIGQVILNLLTNAAHYAEGSEIRIEVTQQEQEMIVSVSDTGPGIAPEDLKQIFEPFRQGMLQLQQIERRSSGLGLSISKEFVELHGGRMWVESTLGIGTTFRFSLPTSLPTEFTTKPGHMIREDWVWRESAFHAGRALVADQLKKPRVIVLDETGSLKDVAGHYSSTIECVVVQEIPEITRELRMCPAHVIVVNVKDPSRLLTLLEATKKHVLNTPLVGCAIPNEQQRAEDAGALGYLIKPVTREKLKEALLSAGRPVKRVLVVDDDPDVLRLFAQTLRLLSGTIEVMTASSGSEALKLLRVTPPDLLLLDVVMPEMDGWQVLESMVREGATVPTYLISARDPTDYPPSSPFLLVTTEDGIPASKVLQCSLAISKALLKTENAPDRVSE